MKQLALVLGLAACGGSHASDPGQHAVGTYVGGGSMLFGADDCTYAGAPGVFATDSATPAKGPRFVVGPGKISVACPKTSYDELAVVPTGATISGPKKIGATHEIADSFSAHLVAGGRELAGEASIDWTLGTDCAGVAAYGDVLGAQDTGGRDRTRTLVRAAKGKCTVIVTLTTGNGSEPGFAGKAFQAEQLVAVE